MKKPQTSFEKVLEQTTRRVNKVQRELIVTRLLTEEKQMKQAYAAAFELAYEVERLALLTRVLPAYTGHPQANKMAEEMLKEIIPVNIGFTREGWFAMSIPALLPKKSKGNANYYREALYLALDRFFAYKARVRYPKCVLIFRHVYDRNRPERQYRDHDNIEVNGVADAVAFFTMKDDHPLCCKHYYCSAAGSADRTEVYVVLQDEFINWLAAEITFPDEGVEMLENRP